ncbi:hypothetical protein P12x_003029 [Tundrisphaera lichenicola]|uniref:hypothetical protein n=1 Tax=Tundrisphaera lichenicola TaxID=2029860 RepID=UPI003EBC3895
MNSLRKTTRRDPNKPRPVVVHPELHRELSRLARENGYTIQGMLHVLLCERFNKPDLVEQTALTAAS